MSLWDWAVSAYDRPPAAAACLALQDNHGQNVSLLLWALWARPDDATAKRGAQAAKEWDRTVLAPLRGVRRALKGSEAGETLREDVKAAELKAERLLLEALEPLTSPSEREPIEALVSASTAWGAGASAPRQALLRLADAVSGI